VKSAVEKVYIQPGTLIYDVMLNIMSLQKGVLILRDETAGRLHYYITIYNLSWTLRFSVFEMDWLRSGVTLEIEAEMEQWEQDGDDKEFLENMIYTQFSLLDSMLLNWRPSCVTYGERRCV
jgi:hypothetical protein